MPTVEVLRAGVDWITATLPSDAHGIAEWRNRGIRHLEDIAKEGYVIKPRGMLGYYGVSAGNCFVGEREADSMVQFTGAHADRVFDRIYRSDAHISRIDLQVTVKTVEREHNVAKMAYKAATRDNNSLSPARRRKLYIIVGSDGGDTCYIGSPASDQRGRIYNKEVQSEDPEFTRCWRYETVHRNGHAVAVSQTVYARGREHSRVCATLCAAWFGKRGVDVNWFWSGILEPLPLVRTLPTDVETKLRWLDEQVKPTIRYLCTLGFRDTLLVKLFPSEETAGE